MCSRKCFRVHTLVILGIIITIVLVCIVGITLTNSINISNIIKLREKVASDSAAATGANAVQTRAALVEQQYSTLQQHHLSRSDLNYIAATHPKNLQRFAAAGSGSSGIGGRSGGGGDPANSAAQNKIVIEIGVRNFSSSPANASLTEVNSANSSLVDTLITRLIEPITSAIVDGNVDSISVPATATRHQANASLSHFVNTEKPHSRANPTKTEIDAATLAATTAATTVALEPRQFTSPATTLPSWQAADMLSIADHNPGQIDFAKREHVKQVSSS
ncbi:uncharacterized protein LOC128857927 isoform X3 [Anastrepha ludens]|uniref:uncharacterized protein LOC128857927 isoform X2 n=1 Tax=Anastrepha ludens TaxID=28586 RepID=UPI0023AF7016|nr:uncharacterized protein LOC128857927 isoform X2 [Anastrepha ludens]XP_053949754.1 uncharacterized protein LOC128857927 isoform X3 [Anastrepha ludens]